MSLKSGLTALMLLPLFAAAWAQASPSPFVSGSRTPVARLALRWSSFAGCVGSALPGRMTR